jgi:hypothetical protein
MSTSRENRQDIAQKRERLLRKIEYVRMRTV